MEARPDDERRQRAEELFGHFLAGPGAAGGGATEFSELVAAHPELAAELRALRDDARALARVRGRIAAGEGVRDPRVLALLDQLAEGRTFEERFELGREIGRGGQGRVVEALERALGRTVAVKSLRSDVRGELVPESRDAFVARFLAEAQITAQLDHPGVCAVHELCVDDAGEPCFTMARVRGSELADVFRRSREGDPEWPRVRCLNVLLRVCETLSFAHARGVVHRDLKPSNVMVGSFGEVFVMDWGLARVSSDGRAEDPNDGRAGHAPPRPLRTVRAGLEPESLLATQPSGNLGTLHYMAPEAARSGAVGATTAVDVYAVGAMLYELVGGRPPYAEAGGRAGATVDDVLARIAAGPPPALERIAPGEPPELYAIAARAMAREPAERYDLVQQLGADLRAFLEGRVVAAHERGAWAELRKWLARNRRLAAALSLAFLAIVGGLGGIAWVQANARAALDLEADLYRLPYLEEEAERLWPETPERAPAYEAWLAQAERLASRLEHHRGELAELRARARPDVDGAVTFAADSDRQRYETLASTVERLAAFARSGGRIDDVRARLDWARSVERTTLSEPAERWERARAAVGAPDGPYGGLELAPRLGLVPLGPDPAAGLEEFAFPRSGRVPERGENGALAYGDDAAIVFVLVPGGTLTMGAQAADPAAPGYDPYARPEEAPVHAVALAPFFVAKHELTQGQWARLGGGRPSFVAADAEGGRPERHPVEGVSWSECVRLLARFELALPTEAQWEYAARASTSGPFFGGDPQGGDLRGAVNLADATVLEAGLGWPQAQGMDWLRDGYLRHAPVGSFAPNPFGLHDVLGNVWEWCLDRPGSYELAVEPGSGRRRVDDDPPERVARGGGFINNAAFARAAIRDMGRSKDFDSAYHGVRPVLAFDE